MSTLAVVSPLSPLEVLLQQFQPSTSPDSQSASPLRHAPGERDWIQEKWGRWDVDGLLQSFPRLSVRPSPLDSLVIAGTFDFVAEFDENRISDSYEIEIRIPQSFPHRVPSVREVAGRIPKKFHKLDDGSLCLGSRLRLHLMVAYCPTISDFARKAIIPYLYTYSYHERHGDFPYGDLDHGVAGLIDDYKRIFQVNNRKAVERMIYLAASEKRKANRHPCPCGSGRRVGKCHNLALNRLRRRLGRSWFRIEYEQISGERTRHHKIR